MPSASWISIAHSQEEVRIVEHKQAYDSILPARGTRPQSPVLVALVGRTRKLAALQFLSGQYDDGDSSPHGQIRLCVSEADEILERPIVYVDCELHVARPTRQAPVVYSDSEIQRRLAWLAAGPRRQLGRQRKSLGQQLYARVLSHFVCVFCLFAADLGGLKGAAEFLAAQASRPPPPDLPRDALPRAVVVLETTKSDGEDSEEKLKALTIAALQRLGVRPSAEQARDSLATYYHSIHLIILCRADDERARLRPRHETNDSGRVRGREDGIMGLKREDKDLSKLQLLETHLLFHARAAESNRITENRLFHLDHLKALLSAALDGFVADPNNGFKLVAASRLTNLPSADFPVHLRELLNYCKADDQLLQTAAPLIASALVLDSSPPGMHFFEAQKVFHEFYYARLFAAVSAHNPITSVQFTFVSEIVEDFEALYLPVQARSQLCTAAERHLSRLMELHGRLVPFKSHRTCFSCLMRTPEKVLSCGHALCDTCIQIFGVKSTSEKYTFRLQTCILCGLPNDSAHFQFIPPTAGIRVLSLDGGGVRGVIPLVILQAVEEEVKRLGCPLRDHFDLVCGTSSGGLIVIGMFLRLWTPQECLARFEELASKVFKRRTSSSLLFTKIAERITTYIADCQYDSAGIEAAFHTAFGPDVQMFNPVNNDTRVSVTTTTARDCQPGLITNYNGGFRPKCASYSVVRAQNPEHDPTVCEAARCTSAAPWYFPAKVMRSLGTFQDGGLRHNNPLKIALWESRYVWPLKGGPDFAFSIGTGMPPRSSAGSVLPSLSPVRDRFISRLGRALMTLMDGEITWEEFKESHAHDTRTQFHRLNPTLASSAIDIDNVEGLADYKARATKYIYSGDKLKNCKDSLHAAMFYFELDNLPVFSNGHYICEGHVFCRMNLPASGRAYLYQLLRSTCAYFLADGRLTPCVDAIPRCLPPFKKQIRLTVLRLTDPISISLGNVTIVPRLISGMPKSVADLVQMQMLDAPFGRNDHMAQEKALPLAPSKKKRKFECPN